MVYIIVGILIDPASQYVVLLHDYMTLIVDKTFYAHNSTSLLMHLYTIRDSKSTHNYL